ncbi:PRC-barrel domain-containing protein [Streptomyces canus]|uniref:PRC-barrel domain-containing protein n=1 Tax=Streptomyces canus TaxID=58343 RepID=UPI0037F848F7
MTVYMRASEIAKKPVVTLAGDDLGQVKDLVFDASTGSIRCFTLVGPREPLDDGPVLGVSDPQGRVRRAGRTELIRIRRGRYR